MIGNAKKKVRLEYPPVNNGLKSPAVKRRIYICLAAIALFISVIYYVPNHKGFKHRILNHLTDLLSTINASPNNIIIDESDAAEISAEFKTVTLPDSDEFVGPFDSWANVKTDYDAIGDGVVDDTAALQRALNELGQAKHSNVLYLPAGTYRITQGLILSTLLSVSVLGEDPATTTIKWKGPQDGIMLTLTGVVFSRFNRLTWDGSGKALVSVDQAWDGKPGYFDTGNEYADDIFQDVGYGIRGGNLGQGAAESSVLRCHFLRCSQAGIIVRNFNALDWFIWYSTFEDCSIGVTNDPGAGNFHVFNSLFLNSTVADMMIHNTMYFSIRNNTSIGSKAFFVGIFVGQNGAPTTIQGNTIIDSKDATTIRIENFGPLLLIDNTIRNHKKVTQGPVVRHSTYDAVDTISVGNTFTVNNPIQANGRFVTIDDKVVARDTIKPNVPTLPGTLPNLQRRVFEAPAGADAATIQQKIDRAVGKGGRRPVVHFAAGDYRIDRTLVIPAKSDLQLVGDGHTSTLKWTGSGAGPVLRLAGPSKATIRDLGIRGAGIASGIVVENADQPGARVFMLQASLSSAEENNLLVDGLDYTIVELHNIDHKDAKGVSIRVVGGPRTANGQYVGGRTNIFAGASSNNNLSYDVTKGSRLLAQDIWYEGSLPGFVRLSDMGTFTLHGAMIATLSKEDTPAVVINNFRGDATVLSSLLVGHIMIEGDGADTNVLAMGIQGYTDNYFANNSSNARAVLLNSRKYDGNIGTVLIPNHGTAEAAFIRQMLAQTRGEQPTRLVALADDITDARFYRVRVEQTLIGIHLKR